MLEGKEFEVGDFYMSPEGYKVFTEQYHLKRGSCCLSGCRHCPYDFKKTKKYRHDFCILYLILKLIYEKSDSIIHLFSFCKL